MDFFHLKAAPISGVYTIFGKDIAFDKEPLQKQLTDSIFIEKIKEEKNLLNQFNHNELIKIKNTDKNAGVFCFVTNDVISNRDASRG